jgi:predicted ABC-type ATPase
MSVDIAREVFTPLGQAGADAFDDTRSWVDDNGRRLSDRLWLAKEADRNAIDTILRGAIASGDDPLKAAKRLEDYLTPVGQATQTATPRSGMGNYAARRLARTEMTRAFGQATEQAAALNPFVEGIKWSLSGRHDESDICNDNAGRSSRGMDRGEYRLHEVPRYPGHPNCRCVLSPVTVKDTDAVVDQIKRDLDAADPVNRQGYGDLPVNEFAKDFRGNSAAQYLEPDGQGGVRFTPERQQLHDAIVKEFTEGVPTSTDPTVFNLGGGPAAGKTTMLKSGGVNVPSTIERRAVLVNPDEMKERLPEYVSMVRAKDPTAAMFTHEESSYLAKRVQAAAIENGQDLLIDGVGTNYQKTLDLAKPAGYKVKGFYAYIPDPEEAVRRATARAVKTGRQVPADYIRGKHIEVSQKFSDAAAKMDEIELYDTSDGARLVARGIGGKLDVIDPAAYDNFLAIGRDA